MMNYLLLLISIGLGVTKNVTSKSGGASFSGLGNLLRINILTAVTALLIFGIGGIDFEYIKDPVFILLAALYGIFTMLSQLLHIVAVKHGPVAVCSLIYSCGFLLPSVFSSVYFNEAFTVTRIIGVALLLLSIVLVTGKITARIGKWLIPSLLAMTSSGIVGILQKLFTAEFSKTILNEYLFFSFGIMLILAVIIIAFVKNKDHISLKSFDFKFAGSALLLSLSIVLANKLNLYLSGALPGTIFFPSVNGGCIALSALMGAVIFKEHLTKLQFIGIALSVAAIVIIAI